jgi:hypothetical protein
MAKAKQNPKTTEKRKPKRQARNAKGSPKRISSPCAPRIRPGSPEFRDLVAEWYAKLAAEGFKDLERPNPRTGLIEPDSMLHGQSMFTLRDRVEQGTQQALYYARLVNFLAHCPDWSLDPWHRLAAQRISEGVPYSQIAIEGHAKGFLKTPNKWFVWKFSQTFVPLATEWNRRSPEGLDFESDF